MSNFLREAKGETLAGAEVQAAEVPDWFMRYLNGALKSPLISLPREHVTYMIDKVASSGLDIPISQIIGFTQFNAQFDYTAALYQTTSSTFQQNGTTITNVTPGRYLAMMGAQAQGGAASNALMELFLGAADAGITAVTRAVTLTSVFAAGELVVTTPTDVSARYASSDNATTCGWQGRILILLKYANL